MNPSPHFAALLVWGALQGCAGGSAAPAAQAPGVVTPEPTLQGSDERGPAPISCLGPEDCPQGVCEGQGCGDAQAGHCEPAVRACTKDLRAYCGCDGRTFRASGRCPGRRYAHRGPCEGDRVPAE